MRNQGSRMVIVEDVRLKGFNYTTIIADTVTGVQYLYSYEGGLTVLLDENGKPLINNEIKRPQ